MKKNKEIQDIKKYQCSFISIVSDIGQVINIIESYLFVDKSDDSIMRVMLNII